jgi:hypothetical protein
VDYYSDWCDPPAKSFVSSRATTVHSCPLRDDVGSSTAEPVAGEFFFLFNALIEPRKQIRLLRYLSKGYHCLDDRLVTRLTGS